jgi:hypothetical protein
MSLEIVRSVTRDYPELVRTNLGSSCWKHTGIVIQRLRAAGHSAYFVCKTAGEGQYHPPGFKDQWITGTDGLRYLCTGVSHDAIYWNGVQVDTLAKANDSEEPIFESDGSPMIAIPVWNVIAKEHYRPNNPPLLIDDFNVPPPPQPPQPPAPAYPPYPMPEDAVDGAGVALFADFAQAGQPPNPQMFRFAFRAAYSWLTKEVPSLDASVAKHRKEWRAILGLPPQ